MGGDRARPGPPARRGRARRGSRRWPRDQGFLDRLGAAKADLDAYLGGDALVPRKAGAEAPDRGSPTSRPSSASPRCCRSTPAASASWPATTSRPPATSACRSSASACSTARGYFKQSLSRDGWQQEQLPRPRPGRAADHAAARGRRRAAPRSPIDLPDGPRRCSRRSGWRRSAGCRCCCSTPTSRATPGRTARSPTASTAAAASTGCCQEMLLGIGGVRAIRAYCRAHRRARARGLPHQRGPRRLPRPRADPRADRRGGGPSSTSTTRSRSSAPAPSSPRTRRCPAGIDRFPRELVEQYFGATGAARRRPGRADPRPRRRGLRRRRPDGLQHGGDGPAARPARQRRLPAARRTSAGRCSHGLWPAFDEAEVPITSITNGVHAPTWVGPRGLRPRRAAHGADADADDADASGTPSTRSPTASIWAVSGCCASGSSHDARRRLRESWLQRGVAAAELGWVDEVLDPDVLTIGFARRVPSYKRLTLMLRDPERLKRAAAPPGAAGPDRHRRQGAPGRRRRQEADPAARASSPTTPRCGTASSSCPTTTSPWPSRSTRAATSG